MRTRKSRPTGSRSEGVDIEPLSLSTERFDRILNYSTTLGLEFDFVHPSFTSDDTCLYSRRRHHVPSRQGGRRSKVLRTDPSGTPRSCKSGTGGWFRTNTITVSRLRNSSLRYSKVSSKETSRCNETGINRVQRYSYCYSGLPDGTSDQTITFCKDPVDASDPIRKGRERGGPGTGVVGGPGVIP